MYGGDQHTLFRRSLGTLRSGLRYRASKTSRGRKTLSAVCTRRSRSSREFSLFIGERFPSSMVRDIEASQAICFRRSKAIRSWTSRDFSRQQDITPSTSRFKSGGQVAASSGVAAAYVPGACWNHCPSSSTVAPISSRC